MQTSFPPQGCQVGQYLLGEKIGSGAVGTVWKAYPIIPQTGLPALPALAFKVQNLGSSTAIDRQFYKDLVFPDFRHPNIMALLDAGFGLGVGGAKGNACPEQLTKTSSDRLGFTVSPWQSGDLFSYIVGNKLSLQDKIDIWYDILCGLASLHENKIVYGDLKPENVLIERRVVSGVAPGVPPGVPPVAATTLTPPVAKLSDFGLFWPQGSKMAQCAQGSIPYMAPEQAFSSMPCNVQMDMWSAGVTGLVLFFNVTLINVEYYLPSPRTRQEIVFLYQTWEEQLGIPTEKRTPPPLILYLFNLFLTWGFPNPAWIQHLTDPVRARILTHLIQQMETSPQVMAVQQGVRRQLDQSAQNTPALKDVILPLLRSLLAFDPSQRLTPRSALALLQPLTSRRCSLAKLPQRGTESKNIQRFQLHKGPSEQEQKWIQATVESVRPLVAGLVSPAQLQALSDHALLLVAEYRSSPPSPSRPKTPMSAFFPILFGAALWMVIQLNVNASPKLERYFSVPLHHVPGLELSVCVQILKDMILQLRKRLFLLGVV